MKIFFSICVLPLLLLAITPARSQEVSFNKVVPPLGNFSGLLGGFGQDKAGNMWIATRGGLYKYDGFRFKVYINDPSHPNSLSNNALETVYMDRHGILWIATWKDGFDRFDPVTSIFTHFQHKPHVRGSLSSDTVRSFLEDRDGILWVGSSGGLDRYDPKTGMFQNFHHDPNDPSSLSSNHVRKIYEDRQGTLWIGTGSIWLGEGGETNDGGLNRFDKKTGKFIRYLSDPANPHALINNKVQAIFEDSKGTFWVGTAGDGLHTMNRSTGTFERHLYDPAHPEKLSRPAVDERTGPDQITFITEDVLNNIWIATLQNGINRYDPAEQKITHFGRRDSAIGFRENSVWSYCNSKDGILWIGTFDGGLYRIDPYHKNIPHFNFGTSVWAFLEDDNNNFWLATEDGIILRNKVTGTTRKIANSSAKAAVLTSNAASVLYKDREGTIWVGARNGLNRYNASSNTFTRYQNNPKDANSITAGWIHDIKEDGDRYLWIGIWDELNLMDKRTGKFLHYRNNPSDTTKFNSSNIVTALLVDQSSNVWVGSANYGGLNYFDRKAGVFKHFLKNSTVSALVMASDGTLWVGTTEGLYYAKKPLNGFTLFADPGTGIENAYIKTLLEDNRHNLWVATNLGIYRIDPRNHQSVLFGASYGINGTDLDRVSYKSLGGDFYFGDQTGYFYFSPDKIKSNPHSPEVAITNFKLDDQAVVPGKDGPLREPVETMKSLSLRHDQNVFSFDLAAVHYSNPENNRLLYQLQGYERDWQEGGAERTVHYSGVPPGHYVFRVRAASSEGVWAERQFVIIINPPWWRTWWAYLLYALCLLAAIFFIDRFQRRRLLAKERERTRERELAQAREIEKAYEQLKSTQAQLIQSEKMASLGELTAGIAHEIQNPLNFVNNFSEINKELVEEVEGERGKANGERDEVLEVELLNEIKQNTEKIIFHGKRAGAIVKGMLQHSRASTDKKEPTDINALADEYLRLAFHGLRAKDKDFNADFKADFDESISKIEIVPQDIGRVLLNLYNNAFQAVAEKKKRQGDGYLPTVKVATKRLGNKIEIIVTDNGTGIPDKVVSKIFQPFFTTKPTGQGTGLGLSLSYDIIKAHGGEIKVESKEGEGSEFIIELPIA